MQQPQYQEKPLFKRDQLIKKSKVFTCAEGTEGRVFCVHPSGVTKVYFDASRQSEFEVIPRDRE